MERLPPKARDYLNGMHAGLWVANVAALLLIFGLFFWVGFLTRAEHGTHEMAERAEMKAEQDLPIGMATVYRGRNPQFLQPVPLNIVQFNYFEGYGGVAQSIDFFDEVLLGLKILVNGTYSIDWQATFSAECQDSSTFCVARMSAYITKGFNLNGAIKLNETERSIGVTNGAATSPPLASYELQGYQAGICLEPGYQILLRNSSPNHMNLTLVHSPETSESDTTGFGPVTAMLSVVYMGGPWLCDTENVSSAFT